MFINKFYLNFKIFLITSFVSTGIILRFTKVFSQLSVTLSFLNKQGNPYKQIFIDYDGSLAINLGAYGIPETLLINNKKIVLLKFIGPLNSQKYQKIIDAINNEK